MASKIQETLTVTQDGEVIDRTLKLIRWKTPGKFMKLYYTEKGMDAVMKIHNGDSLRVLLVLLFSGIADYGSGRFMFGKLERGYIAGVVGVSEPTMYRRMKDLVTAGFVQRAGNNNYNFNKDYFEYGLEVKKSGE